MFRFRRVGKPMEYSTTDLAQRWGAERQREHTIGSDETSRALKNGQARGTTDNISI